ncbi:Exonuclease RNase T/DNA polymerase III [Trinorchestia longiramus]|nr:Exonuclease RNase T/DNA polymerase III [Trinorchestia longiramus]
MSASENNSKKMKKDERLVWVDLEMTGLDVGKEEIMEAAVLVTDGDLAVVAEGPNLILKVDSKVLDNMGEWCKNQHGKSGLTDKCLNSDVSVASAEDQLLEFIKEHTQAGTAPLAGNSIGADKKFLDKYMPRFMAHLHYRVVDVSTVKELCRYMILSHLIRVEKSIIGGKDMSVMKELCRRWYPTEFAAAPKKALSHRALEDIKESIKELQYYRSSIFK